MRHAIVLGLLLAAAAPAFAASPEDEAELRGLLEGGQAAGPEDEAELRRLIEGGQVSEDRIHPDVMFTNIFGSVYQGRTDYVDRHRYLMTELFKGMTGAKGSIQRFFFVRPDVALVLIESVITGLKFFPPGPAITPDGTLRTIGLAVFTKENGRWIQAAWHNTDVKPAVPGSR